MADKTPEPGLIEINYEQPEETTDPTLFVRHEEVTVRRCANCNAELGPCDGCDRKWRAGAAHVLNTVYQALCRKMSVAEAREVVDGLAKESGVELV